MQNVARHHRQRDDAGDFSFRITESRDARYHERAISGLKQTYHQVAREPFRARLTELGLGPVRIVRDEVTHAIDYVGESIEGVLVFFVFLSPEGHSFWDCRPVTANTVIKFPRNRQHRVFCNGPNESVAILIEEADLLRSARARGLDHVDANSLAGELFLSDPRIVSLFRECAGRILREAGGGARLIENECWRAQALETVRATLLEVLLAGIAAPGRLPPPPTRAYIVEKAIQQMSASLADPPSMQRICAALRVSSRTLRYSFEEILGVSPTQYMTVLRLDAVRERLQEGVPVSTINRIAQDYGFGHMGRFAQFYRETFGELPSETCRRSAPDGAAPWGWSRSSAVCPPNRAGRVPRTGNWAVPDARPMAVT